MWKFSPKLHFTLKLIFDMTASKANPFKNGIANTKDIPPSTHSRRESTRISRHLFPPSFELEVAWKQS